jgi:hypothetical protein
VKTVKRKAKSAVLVWKEFGLTAGYHSHTAPAAKGSLFSIEPASEGARPAIEPGRGR